MTQKPKTLTFPLLLAVISSCFGSAFIFGYQVGVFNAPSEPIQFWIRNVSYPSVHGRPPSETVMVDLWSWITASLFLSATIGGLACGFLADKLGRKGTMLVNNALVLLSALLLGISKVTNLYFLLLIGQIIAGFSCSISSSLPPLYLTEIAPLHLRGFMASLSATIVILGIFLSEVLGQPQLLGSETLWPLLLAFTAVPAIFHIITMPFCVESPKYLLCIKKDEKAARAALVKLRQTEDVVAELKSLPEVAAKSLESGDAKNQGSKLFWWRISICIFNHVGRLCSGAIAVLFFSSIIFREQASMTNSQAVGATLGVGAVFFFSSIISTAIVERLGRRVLMLGGIIGTMIFDIAIFVVLHLMAIDSVKYHAAAYAAVVFVYLYIFALAIGPASIPWVYTNEIFEPVVRGKANMIITTASWLTEFLAGVAFLPMKESMGEYVFLVYAGTMVLTFIYIYVFAPETRGRQYNEVAKELESKCPRFIRW